MNSQRLISQKCIGICFERILPCNFRQLNAVHFLSYRVPHWLKKHSDQDEPQNQESGPKKKNDKSGEEEKADLETER